MKKRIALWLLWLGLAALPLWGQIPVTETFFIQSGQDDAEEAVLSGAVNLTSTDLEMVQENTKQIVGLRFTGVSIPNGATVTQAYIQFTADEINDEATSLMFHGELTNNAQAFSSTAFNISSRTITTATVLWNDIPVWDEIGEDGADQRTPDLTTLLNEILSVPGWTAGNAMVFIISGEGKRNAMSFNNSNNSPPRLVVTYEVTEFPVQLFPIEAGSLWKYEDSGEDPGVGWISLDYDDSSWDFGAAQFGYGEGDESTELEDGGDQNNRHITYYFRKRFSVANPAAYDSLTLNLLRDDGAIVYLNGQEILRAGMPEGAVDFQTLAIDTVEGSRENEFSKVELANILQQGDNILAVEIHQADPSSDDLSFDLSFTGKAILPPSIQLIHNSPDPSLSLVDIYIDAFQLGNFVKLNGNTPVPFRFGTPYINDLPPGTHNIAISPFGFGTYEWSITSFTVENNKRYVLMVSGVVDTTLFERTYNSGTDIAFKIQVNEVPGPQSIGPGETLPLLFHGTPDLPNIRIMVVGIGEATGILPDGLPYGADLVGAAVPALPLPLVQITNNTSTELYGEFKVNLLPFSRQVIPVFTSGFYTAEGDAGVNASNFQLMVMPPTGGFAIPFPAPDPPLDGKIQIIHNTPDSELSTVDVWVNGQKTVENLGFREATAFFDIPVGTNRVAVAPHSMTEADTAWSAMDIVIESDLDLNILQPVGRTYVAVAYGARNTAAFENEINLDVDFGLTVGEARQTSIAEDVTDVRFFHGGIDLGGVNIFLDAQFVPIVADLVFGNLSPTYLSLESDAGIYKVGVTDQDDLGVVINSYDLDLSEDGGKALIIFASGVLELNGGLPVFGLYAVVSEGGPARELVPSALSSQDIQSLGIEVFPNPVSDHLTIQWEHSLPDLHLMDLSGRVLRRIRPGGSSFELDMQGLEKGIYLLEFDFREGGKSMRIFKH